MSDPSDGEDTNNGMESLVFVPNTAAKNGKGYFYAGRQKDARICVFDILDDTVHFAGALIAPGPEYDLSAMTLYRDRLYFLYDKEKLLLAVSSKDPAIQPHRDINTVKTLTNTNVVGAWHFTRRGQEGIAFGSSDGQNWAIFAIDPPKKKGRKDIVRFHMNDFVTCFNHTKLPFDDDDE